MGLFDKLKDLFMDEVVDDEEIELEEENESIYKEPKDVLPKVMRDTIKKEEEGIKFEELKPLRDEPKIKEEPIMYITSMCIPSSYDYRNQEYSSSDKNFRVLEFYIYKVGDKF